jgi:hypothetical protein
MKTLIIQSYRTRDVPAWIARCLSSVRAWAQAKGYDYQLTDDSVFALCGDDYLARVGDNKRSITNLCRLELIKLALAEGYERAIWMDADILVFAADHLDFAPTERISFPRETWLAPAETRWTARLTLNNCVVVCPRGDPDLDLVIQATRHRARHPVTDNLQVGVDLVRGLHSFMTFPLLSNVGMFSNHAVMAIAEGREEVIYHQAVHHGSPVYAANLCASDHLSPVVPEAMAHAAMDRLERTAGEVVNRHLSEAGEASRYPRARLIGRGLALPARLILS